MKSSDVICCCMGYTINDLKEDIKNGVRSFEELQQKTNISTDCPTCKDVTKPLYEKYKEEFNKSNNHVR